MFTNEISRMYCVKFGILYIFVICNSHLNHVKCLTVSWSSVDEQCRTITLFEQLSNLHPPSSFSFSTKTKLRDGCLRMSSRAVARPTMPPPTTATSCVLKDRRTHKVTGGSDLRRLLINKRLDRAAECVESGAGGGSNVQQERID